MLFLAHLLNCPVHGKAGEPIGKLDDIIVRMDHSPYPSIAGITVRDRGRRFFVPGSQLTGLNGVAKLNTSVVNMQSFERRDGEVLLAKDVLDHQIIDITGRRIVRVNDVQIAQIDAGFHVVGVDVSPQALLRRLAPRRFGERIRARNLIDWDEVQYLASAAPVQLKVSYDRLSELNPVDLARIVDALSFRESAEIIDALDDETAAETLEEVSDERLADLLEDMDAERAADILEEMDPGAAADALEDLEEDVAESILARIEPEEAADIQEALSYDEDTVGRIMTGDFVRVPVSDTVRDALTHIHLLEEPPDPLLAVYVVSDDDADELRGVVRLRSLLIADPITPLREIMEDDLPTVHPDDRTAEVARLLAEYNLLAVPVLDDTRRLIGIATVDDALAVLLPDIWTRRGARAFA